MSGTLGYHELSGGSWTGISPLSPSRFETHLDALARAGMRFVREDVPGTGDPGPGRLLRLTLDDALSDQVDIALRVLSRRRIPATLFVPTDFVGRPASWDYRGRTRRHADWSQLREWLAAGMAIGSHGAAHRNLCSLSESDLRGELVQSRTTLEDRLGIPVRTIAYPFGRCDRRVSRAAAETGYVTGFTTDPAPPVDLPLARGRCMVSRLDTPRAILHRLGGSPWGLLEQGKQRLITFWSGGTSRYQWLRDQTAWAG